MSHDVRHAFAAGQLDHGASCPWPYGTAGRPRHGLGGKPGEASTARAGRGQSRTAHSTMHAAGTCIHRPPYTSLRRRGGTVPTVRAGPGTQRYNCPYDQGTPVESSGADLVPACRCIASRCTPAWPSMATGIPD